MNAASVAAVSAGPSRQGKRSGRRARDAALSGRLGWPARLLLLSLFIPWTITFGPLSLSPNRFVLLAMVVPSLGWWLAGKAGPKRLADWMILGYCVWAAVSLFVLHVPDVAMQPSGILFVEVAGSYFMARCFVRSADELYDAVRVLFLAILLIAPFALFEAITGRNLLLQAFSALMPSHVSAQIGARWGLTRVQSVFEHPILFGVSTGSILALVNLALTDVVSASKRWTMSVVVAMTAFLSMSSGPLTALTIQIFLLCWNWALQKNPSRWQMLWCLVILFCLLIKLVSNQTVPEFLMTHFSFDPASAYYRVLIWEFGSQSVENHPLFGIGLGQWDRPSWMTSSIDMFWLYHAILYGLPAGIMIMGAYFASVIPVARATAPDEKTARCRTAYLIAMTGYFAVGWTVHFWNGTLVLFLFLLGSGAWLAELSVPKRVRKAREIPASPGRSTLRPNGPRASRHLPLNTHRPASEGIGS